MTTKTIWKFELRTVDVQTVTMPSGAALLSLQMQRGVPCIWALVDPMAPAEERTFVTFGTGHPVPAAGGMSFLGTYQFESRDLVFHVFMLDKPTVAEQVVRIRDEYAAQAFTIADEMLVARGAIPAQVEAMRSACVAAALKVFDRPGGFTRDQLRDAIARAEVTP